MPDKRTAVDLKFWAGTVLAEAGLLIGIFALWLTIKDRPTVSLGPPSDPNNLLSAEVTIVNNGVLAIQNVSFDVYLKRVEMGNTVIEDSIAKPYRVPTGILRPGEPLDTPFDQIVEGGFTYHSLDVALIAHFTPVWAPFWNRTRAFRFITKRRPNGSNVLEQAPAENIEDDYQRALAKTGH